MGGAFSFVWVGMASTVTFTPNLSAVSSTLRRRLEQVPDALAEFAEGQAAQLETYAKEHRPWTDQTNAARAGLTGQVVREGARISIVLYHSATDPNSGYEYPKVLELGSPPQDNGHPGVPPHPIIAPTFAAHQTQIAEGARRIVMSLIAGKVS